MLEQARLDTLVIIRRDVTSQVGFGLYTEQLSRQLSLFDNEVASPIHLLTSVMPQNCNVLKLKELIHYVNRGILYTENQKWYEIHF